MSTLTANQLSLVEVAKRHDPNGDMATVAEVLNEDNEIVQDAIWKEANDTFSNKTTRRASLPQGTWRGANEGVDPETSKTIEMTDTIGILETRAKNDVVVIKAFNDPKQAREDENKAFIEGLGQTMASTMIYGNTIAEPKKFTGLAPRLDALAASANVLNAGGTGSDLTSIYVIDWGVNTVFMTYPKNSKAGLDRQDLGMRTVQDENGKDYEAYVDLFTWYAGMVVKNYKSIGRIANIEQLSVGANNFDEDDLITLLNRMTKSPGRRIYVNESIMTQMEIREKDKTNAHYTKADNPLAPGPVLYFKGVPIRQVDKILNAEDQLT